MMSKEQMKELEKKAQALTLSKFGSARLRYLKEHRKDTYREYLESGELENHLLELDKEALKQRDLIMKQQMKADGVNETLKDSNYPLYLAKMETIQTDANHQVMQEMIFV